MSLLYNLGIYTYRNAIWAASPFKKKARQWISGRWNIFEKLRKDIKQTDKIVWVHCASLGEFEQGRPVIETIKKEYPTYKILITFYSPSGYEVRKNYELTDYVYYLPLDTKSNAQKFIDIVNPRLVIWVKYEYWRNFLMTLKEREIPVYLVSAIFSPSQFILNHFTDTLQSFTHIFVQDKRSKDILKTKVTAVTLAGDTRVDRVAMIPQQAKSYPIVERFIDLENSFNKVFIIGSSWGEDEAILLPYINQYPTQFKYIIAPHEIGEGHLKQIEKGLAVPFIRYSKITKETNLSDVQVLIIDNIGMLSSLYQYGTIAYIGGGFKTGLHNTLEPITFGLPVLFGNKVFQKFEEACALVKTKGGFKIIDFEDLKLKIANLLEPDFYEKTSKIAHQYINENQGATKKIMEFVDEILN